MTKQELMKEVLKEKQKQENLKDPFWVMRELEPDLDNDDLYDLYVQLNLFKNEEEQHNAESYLAEVILLDMEE